jgi:hypothetical protein
VWFHGQRMAYVCISIPLDDPALTSHSVGLRVTSLKWTGPECEGSEAPPRIPAQLEYSDVVRRADDIECPDAIEALAATGDAPLGRQMSADSFQGTSQDLRILERLKSMLGVRSLAHTQSISCKSLIGSAPA